MVTIPIPTIGMSRKETNGMNMLLKKDMNMVGNKSMVKAEHGIGG